MLDNRVFSAMAALATCLCAEIANPANEVPDVCFCGVLPGDSPALDFVSSCDPGPCGMAWVRLITAYPATAPGSPSTLSGNCGTELGVDIEIGIVRCAAVGDEFGNPPSEATLLAETQLQIADMLLMQRAVLCCDSFDPRDALLGTYTPTGPEGGLVGGTFTVSIAV